MLNPKIFKTYDIRGVYDQDFGDEHAYQIGLAYGILRRKEITGTDTPFKIAVACDMRLSSPTLYKAVADGLFDAGAEVVNLGLCSTPSFYFAVANNGLGGGIIVSASHNPSQYNGFKIVRERALPVGLETGLADIRDIVIAGGLQKSGGGSVSEIKNIAENQALHDLNYADVNKIKKFKIVIDTASAMGALYFDALFAHLPQCEIIKMNWDLDGSFPAHEADPFKPENTIELSQKIVEEKADLGIATDGDGDRIFFLDETGARLDPGITRAILCKIFLGEQPGAKIAYDIRPGRITRDIIVENGGTPIVTRVGHSLIKAQAIAEGALFAGESSGHFFLNMGAGGCYEVPNIVVLKILEELSQSEKTLSQYARDYERYFHSGEINSIVNDPDAKIDLLRTRYSDGQQNEMDGITVEYDDYWFNVRKSNTEPLLRLNLEAISQKIMEEKRDELLRVIRGL